MTEKFIKNMAEKFIKKGKFKLKKINKCQSF